MYMVASWACEVTVILIKRGFFSKDFNDLRSQTNNHIYEIHLVISVVYRIRPYYRPCPHNRPLTFCTLFSLIITDLTIFVLTFYFIFTYYRPLDDLLALVVENKFT